MILTIIDTPGMCDTLGPGKDKENIDKIVSRIKAVGTIHAILFVCKSTESKLDQGMKYMIQEIQLMLPKSFKDNVIICLTAATNAAKMDALQPLRGMGFDTAKIYKFENDCFIHPNDYRALFLNNPEYFNDNSDDDNTDLEDLIDQSARFWRKNA